MVSHCGFILISPKSNEIEHLYILGKFRWSVFPSWLVLLVSSFRTICLTIEPEIFSHYFDNRVIILHFGYKSKIYFELTFCKVWSLDSLFLPTDVHLLQTICWKGDRLFNCFCIFVKNHLSIFVWTRFWTLYSVLLICVSMLLLRPGSFVYCSYTISHKVG